MREATRVAYFAYGANVHPGWLRRRVPEAELHGAALLPGYRLVFRKRGRDGAARSDACPSTTPGDALPGALYWLPPESLERLGAAGAGYRSAEVVVRTVEGEVHARTWLAEPTEHAERLLPWDWYVELIRAGAELLELPAAHRRWLQGVPVTRDPDRTRAATAHQVIAGEREVPGSPRPVHPPRPRNPRRER